MRQLLSRSNHPLFIACVLLSCLSCDFTPPLHKKVVKAQEFISSQEYAKAIYQYEELLKGDLPKDMKIKVSYQLGELYSLQMGDNEKAIEYYNAVKEIADDPLWQVKAEEKVGDINFSYLRHYAPSAVSYKRLLSFVPKLAKQDFYEYRLGMSYLNDGQLEKGADIFSTIQKNSNHEYFIQSFYAMGLLYFGQKEWARAIVILKEYIKRETRKENVAEAKFIMANSYEMLEKLKLAYDLYYSILGDYPNTEVVQNRLNSIYNRRIARRR